MIIDQSANSRNKKKNWQKINSNSSSRISESFISKLIRETITTYDDNCSTADEFSDSKDTNHPPPKIQLFDQFGQIVRPLDISSRHVCVISACNEASVNLTLKIIHSFLTADVPFEVINGSDFCNLSIAEKLDTSLQYLVRIDIDIMNIEDLYEINSFCATKFIFKLPGLEINPTGVVQDEHLLGHLIWNLDGNFVLMRRLIASLSDDEFVVISNDGPSICSLRGVEECPDEESKQKIKNNNKQ